MAGSSLSCYTTTLDPVIVNLHRVLIIYMWHRMLVIYFKVDKHWNLEKLNDVYTVRFHFFFSLKTFTEIQKQNKTKLLLSTYSLPGTFLVSNFALKSNWIPVQPLLTTTQELQHASLPGMEPSCPLTPICLAFDLPCIITTYECAGFSAWRFCPDCWIWVSS